MIQSPNTRCNIMLQDGHNVSLSDADDLWSTGSPALLVKQLTEIRTQDRPLIVQNSDHTCGMLIRCLSTAGGHQ